MKFRLAKIFYFCLSAFSLILSTNGNQLFSIDSDYQIIVDFGDFQSSADAANAEEKIDWNGKNVLAMNACTENFAAQELQKFLCLMLKDNVKNSSSFKIFSLDNPLPTKAIILCNLSRIDSQPKIAEIIKQKNLSSVLTEPESFAIFSEGKKIFIIGQNRVGTLYGIYSLLEMFGMRWYQPGELGQILPKREKLFFLQKLIIESPKFKTRGFWITEDRGDSDFYFWMARNRLNYLSNTTSNHALLRKLGMELTVGGHDIFARFLNPDNDYPYNHALFNGDEKKPKNPYQENCKQFLGDSNNDGKLSYFEAHPEWYGLVSGKRQGFRGDFGYNICTSNNEVISELCGKLINEFADGKWREATSINFWPLDRGDWCECESCRKLGPPTDRLLLLVHQIRQAMVDAQSSGRITHQIKINFPIYLETLSPPSRPLPENFDYDNCIGTFFPVRRCYGHFLDDSTCTENNSRIWFAFSLWTKQEPRYYHGQFFVGEYYNVSTTKNLPVLYTRIMDHDIKQYHGIGVNYCHYMHVCTKLLGMKRLNNYLFGKLLWNPNADTKKLLDDYFKKFYGKAANGMVDLYKELEYAMSGIAQLKHGNPLTTQINFNREPLFNFEHLKFKEYHPKTNDGVDLEESYRALKKCRKIMDGILSQKWPPILQRRLHEDSQNLYYAENTIGFYFYLVQSIQAKRDGNLEQAKSFFKKTVPYAKKLLAETEIVQTSSAFANSDNGLTATLVADFYFELGKELSLNYNSSIE